MLTEKDVSVLERTISILSTNVKILKGSGEHIAARDTLELCGHVQAIIDRSKAEAEEQKTKPDPVKEIAAAVVATKENTAAPAKPGIIK